MTDKINVRSEILKAIAATNDNESKTLLLLMLGVLEEIGGKIDEFLRDEKTLRDKVLNGHEPIHHAHHDHVAKCIENKCFDDCEWVKRKRKEEEEAEDNKKTLKQQFWEAVVNQAGSIIVVAIATAVGVMSYLK